MTNKVSEQNEIQCKPGFVLNHSENRKLSHLDCLLSGIGNCNGNIVDFSNTAIIECKKKPNDTIGEWFIRDSEVDLCIQN